MKPVRAELVHRSASPAKATRQSQERPERRSGTQPGRQSKSSQGGDQGPFTSPVWQVSYNREALKAAGYHCQLMNHLGQEKWANSGRVVDLEPDGHWAMRRIRDGRRLAEGQGHGALHKAIADPSLGLDIRDLVQAR
jgi:hypothetical protein